MNLLSALAVIATAAFSCQAIAQDLPADESLAQEIMVQGMPEAEAAEDTSELKEPVDEAADDAKKDKTKAAKEPEEAADKPEAEKKPRQAMRPDNRTRLQKRTGEIRQRQLERKAIREERHEEARDKLRWKPGRGPGATE